MFLSVELQVGSFLLGANFAIGLFLPALCFIDLFALLNELFDFLNSAKLFGENVVEDAFEEGVVLELDGFLFG